MKMERGEPRLERRPRTENGQTGRTERDWSMDDDRRDIICWTQISFLCFRHFLLCSSNLEIA